MFRHGWVEAGDGDGAGDGEVGLGVGEGAGGLLDVGPGDGAGLSECGAGAAALVPGRGGAGLGRLADGGLELARPGSLAPAAAAGPVTEPNGLPGPLACGGLTVKVTDAVMMYTRVAAITMITGGSSSSGWARKATAPLRRVDLVRSQATASATLAFGSAGPYPMLALRWTRISAARRSAGVSPGTR